MYFCRQVILFVIISLFISTTFYGQSDADKAREVRHFFRPSLYMDFFATGYRNIEAKSLLDSRNRTKGEKYKFSLVTLGFYLPVYTKTWETNGLKRPTLHVLATGNGLFAKPDFEVIKNDHRLYKLSLGIRMIYTDGGKNSFFFNFSPFISQDQYTFRNPTLRYWAVLLYNRTVSEKFSFRVGVLKTFLLADLSYFLPFVGVRIGRLDRTYVSIQFPRNISVNFPILKNKIYGSVYSRPIGGVFNYNNGDSSLADINRKLRPSNIGSEIQFRFYEILTGMQVDFKINPNFSFYMGAGFSTARNIGFAFDERNKIIHKSQAVAEIANSLFINIGFNLSFGESKKIGNNYQMYDAFYMNTNLDPGDNNVGNRELNIMQRDKELKNVKVKKADLDYKDLKDLIYDIDN